MDNVIYRNRNLFQKVFEYIIISLKIKFKTLFEYKANLYMAIINNLTYVIIQTLLLTTLYLNFNDVINWSFEMYVFFFLITNVIFRFSGIFIFGIKLREQLLSGELNIYIFRPISVFVQSFMNSLFVIPFFIASTYSLAFIIFLIFFNQSINFFNFLILIPFLILSFIFNVLAFRLIDSLAFFLKNNQIFIFTYFEITSIFMTIPITFFPDEIRKYFYFVATIFYGGYSTLFLFGKISFQDLLYFFGIILIMSFILIMLIVLIWHYGLKRYEAYG